MKKLIGFGSVFVTFIVIGLLILSGPASASNIKIDIGNKEIPGDNSTINVSIDLNELSKDNINHIKLTLTGGKGNPTRNCIFDVDGNLISKCLGIKEITAEDGETGYGYGNGELNFIIELDNSINEGNYGVEVKVLYKNGDEESESGSFSIKSNSKKSK